MRAIDFFCGSGGLTRGLLDAGLDVRAGFDVDGECEATYLHNNPSSRFKAVDVRDLGVQLLRNHSGIRTFDDVLFAGCAPCQPFSKHRRSGAGEHDATLLSEFGRIVESALPRAVLIENVPGMAKVKGFSTFRRFLRMLENNRYSFTHAVLDAKYFGVPQNRRRLVLIAFKGLEASLPERSHGNTQKPLRTVRDAIFHFPQLSAGESHANVPNHVAAAVSELNLERLRFTPADGGDRRAWPKRLVLQCHKGGHAGHTDVYGRMAWDAPAPTLTGRCYSISNGRYGHPEQDRAISLREAAALQSFPDRYEFFSCNKNVALQIGNAVPVRFAESLGRHILKCMSKSKQNRRRSRFRASVSPKR